MSIADVLEFCKVELDFISCHFHCRLPAAVCRKRGLSLERGPFSCCFTRIFRPAEIPTPSSREAPLIHVQTPIFLCVFSVGWNHHCGYLRFLLQTGEAVHQKFMPVSLRRAQLPNKINLKHVPSTGNSRVGNQFANLSTNLDSGFFNGGVQS